MTNPVLIDLLKKAQGSLPVNLPQGSISSEAIEFQPQGAAIADPSGGATKDAEARTAINAILEILRTHREIAS